MTIFTDIPTAAGWQRHHLIPLELAGHPVISQLATVMQSILGGRSFSLEDASRNSLLLPTSSSVAEAMGRAQHLGPHASYTFVVSQQLSAIQSTTAFEKMTNEALSIQQRQVALAEVAHSVARLQNQLRVGLLEETAGAWGRFALNIDDPDFRRYVDNYKLANPGVIVSEQSLLYDYNNKAAESAFTRAQADKGAGFLNIYGSGEARVATSAYLGMDPSAVTPELKANMIGAGIWDDFVRASEHIAAHGGIGAAASRFAATAVGGLQRAIDLSLFPMYGSWSTRLMLGIGGLGLDYIVGATPAQAATLAELLYDRESVPGFLLGIRPTSGRLVAIFLGTADGGYVLIQDIPDTSLPPEEADQPLVQPRCFVAGTPILVAGGSEKPIEQVSIGDVVMAFDPAAEGGRGALVPRPVTRIFQNIARTILDLRGLRMTPGHVCLSGEDNGRFETITAILRRDGTLVDRHGTRLRARTGAVAGSPEDMPVTVLYAEPGAGGTERRVTVRAGIPCPAPRSGGTAPATLLATLTAHGFTPLPDGTLRGPDGEIHDACDWPQGCTPFDAEAQQCWIVRGDDGSLFVPGWVAELEAEAAIEHRAAAINATGARTMLGSTSAGGGMPMGTAFQPRVIIGGLFADGRGSFAGNA